MSSLNMFMKMSMHMFLNTYLRRMRARHSERRMLGWSTVEWRSRRETKEVGKVDNSSW